MKLPVLPLAIQPIISALLVIATLFSALNYQGHDYSYRWNMLALFILLMLTVVHLLRHYPEPLHLKRQYALLSYGLLMLWSGLSLFWSAVPSDSLLAWLTQLTGLFALYLGYQASQQQWRVFKILLLPLALVVATYTLYQSQVLEIARPSGFMLNWNSNAAFLGLLMLPFCALFLQTNSAPARHSLGWFLLYCAIAMAVTQSRGGLLVLLIGLVPLCWVAYRLQTGWQVITLLLIYPALGYVIADFLQGGAFSGRMVQQMGAGDSVAGTLESLGSGRHALWAAGWQMYLDKPLLGWGQGMYHWLYPQYRDPLLVEGGQMAHNDYLDTLIGLGVFGLLLLLAFVASVLGLFWRAMQAKNLALIALAGGVIGVLIHSFFTFNFSQSAIVIVIGLYVGYLSRGLQEDYAVELKPLGFNPSLYYGVVGICGLVLSVWLGALFMGFYYAKQSAIEKQPSKRLAYLDRASQWAPYMEQYDAIAASIVINQLKQNDLSWMSADDYQASVNYALEKVQSSTDKNPFRSRNYRRRAELLETQELSMEQAQLIIDAYQNTLKYDPYDLEARYRLALFLEKLEREGEANRLLVNGLNKAYYANLRAGFGYLLKLQEILAASSVAQEQKSLIDRQLQTIGRLMLKQTMGVFVLPDLQLEQE